RSVVAERVTHFGGRALRATAGIGPGEAIDGDDDRGRAFEHGIRAADDELSGSARFHLASTVTAPGPGLQTRVRLTPGTIESASDARSALSACTKALRCGPASTVKKMGMFLARSSRTFAMRPSVESRK